MPDQTEWVNLYNPTVGGWHRVPDNAAVVQDFRDRGWELPDDTESRLLAEAGELRGKALDQALRDAELPTSGTVDEKRARLAEHEAESAKPTEESEEL